MRSRYYSFLAATLFAFGMSTCVEELPSANPGIGSYKMINSLHDLDLSSAGVTLRKSANGFELYDFDGSYFHATSMDAQGALINQFTSTISSGGFVDPQSVDPLHKTYAVSELGTTDILRLVRFNKSYGDGKVVAGSQANFEVEVRFGPGQVQHAFYLDRKNEPILLGDYESYDVMDYRQTSWGDCIPGEQCYKNGNGEDIGYPANLMVPFTVWDVTSIPNRQLEVCFNNQYLKHSLHYPVFFRLFPLNSANDTLPVQGYPAFVKSPYQLESREYVYITDLTYDDPDALNSLSVTDGIRNHLSYAIWPSLSLNAHCPVTATVSGVNNGPFLSVGSCAGCFFGQPNNIIIALVPPGFIFPSCDVDTFGSLVKTPSTSSKLVITNSYNGISANSNPDFNPRNFFLSSTGDWIVSSTDYQGNGLQGISAFTVGSNLLTHQNTRIYAIEKNVHFVSAGIFKLEDGGFMAATRRKYNNASDSIQFTKLTINYDTVYTAKANTADWVTFAEDFKPLFAEANGHYYFVIFDSQGATPSLKIMEVTEQSITPVNTLDATFSPSYFLQFGSKDQYALLSNDGTGKIVDGSFNALGTLNLHASDGGKLFNLYAGAGDQLFFTGVPSASANTRMVIGIIRSANDITSNSFDFGGEIIAHVSCLLPDGGVGTLVQIRSTEHSSDVILFEVDGSLNLTNINH